MTVGGLCITKYVKYMSLVMRKPAFCICENKDADQLRGNREADQRLCFCYIDSKSLFFLNTKFQASRHLVWLYSPVCVGPGRKPRRHVFSQRGLYHTTYLVPEFPWRYKITGLPSFNKLSSSTSSLVLLCNVCGSTCLKNCDYH